MHWVNRIDWQTSPMQDRTLWNGFVKFYATKHYSLYKNEIKLKMKYKIITCYLMRGVCLMCFNSELGNSVFCL